MPELLPVQSILFQNLLRDFQIIAAPRVPVWWMSDIIQPVALVNSQIVLDANLNERVELFATNGPFPVPGAGLILADTGALPPGNYKFRVWVNFFDQQNNNQVLVQHRNAADAANIWVHELYGSAVKMPPDFRMEWTEALVENERVRLVVALAGGAGSRYTGIVWRTLIT